MISRVARLVRAEWLKLSSHPFFLVSVVLLAAATLLGAWGGHSLFGGKPGPWRPPSALLSFAVGAKYGLKLASFLLVVFGAQLFAGEFDKGTIKLLLTRPITRTDLFLAKALAGISLSALFAAGVLALAFAAGCATGELGPVWDSEHYVAVSSWEQVSEHARDAVRTALPAVGAALFLGLAVSALVESSALAVAVSLALYFALDLGLGLAGDRAARYFFGWYPGYALDVLRQFAEGTAVKWDDAVRGGRYWKVPAISSAAASVLAYAAFRFRNVLG